MPAAVVPSSHRLPAVMWTAVRHGRQMWRALRRGDQSIMISALLDLARKTSHPDAYVLDARPLGPKIMVIYSAEGLRAVGDCGRLDKGPTANIAVGVSGTVDAYEAIMGPARGRPYQQQIALLDAIIKRSQRGLRRLAKRRIAEHLAPPCEVSLRRVQYYTASVILDQIFPAHAWTHETISETIDALERNAAWLGPAMQNGTMRGHGPDWVVDLDGLTEVVDRYERVFGALADEERARASASTQAEDSSAPLGLVTQLAHQGLSWADTKALIATFFAASYETVSTALTEWLYQVTTAPDLWRAMQDAEGELRRQRIKASLYEAVRIITPLPILMRRAEEDCTLEIATDDGRHRSLSIEPGQLVLGLSVAPLRDEALFPDSLRMRLDLDTTQRERIRLAWGLQAREGADGPDRFCQGFSYSVALMTTTIETLLDEYAPPSLITDSPIEMHGTQSRSHFVASLAARP